MVHIASYVYHTGLPEPAQAHAAQYEKHMKRYASEFYHTVLPEIGQAKAAQYDKTMTPYAP